MLNAYRVLLTRARQGIFICIPKGNSRLTPEGFQEGPTRFPEFYDGTYEYLKGLGIKEIWNCYNGDIITFQNNRRTGQDA